jgi:tetratricopeptide (TPR) repeat protein
MKKQPQQKLVLRFAALVLALAPICLAAQVDKGKSLYEAKKYAEAEKLLKAVPEKVNGYAAAQYYLGRIAFDKRDYEAAAEYFNEATDVDPKQADYYNGLGDAYAAIATNANVFRQAGLAVKVKNAWEKAVELDPTKVEARASLISFYSAAPGFMGGSMTKAKAQAMEIIKLNPAEGHWQMGSLFAREKNYPEAEKEFAIMLKINPSFVRNLGGYYADQKQYDRAFSSFEEALKANPEDYPTLYNYGKAVAKSGQKLDRGEECLVKYLGHSPSYDEPSLAGAYMRLGQIKEKKGNKAEARKYFEQALKQDDSLSEAKEGLKRTSI